MKRRVPKITLSNLQILSFTNNKESKKEKRVGEAQESKRSNRKERTDGRLKKQVKQTKNLKFSILKAFLLSNLVGFIRYHQKKQANHN